MIKLRAIPRGILVLLSLSLWTCADSRTAEEGRKVLISGNKNETVSWTPASPRIGDYVVLTRDTAGPQRILVTKPGEFRVPGGEEILWTVPEEKNFPDGWVYRSPEEVLPASGGLFLLLGGLLLLAGAAGGAALWNWNRGRRTKPGQGAPGEISLLKDLESFKFHLHEWIPGRLGDLIPLLDRVWTAPAPAAGRLSQAWFFTEGMTWESLEERYRNRRELGLFSGDTLGWEVWEEELDAALFRVREV